MRVTEVSGEDIVAGRPTGKGGRVRWGRRAEDGRRGRLDEEDLGFVGHLEVGEDVFNVRQRLEPPQQHPVPLLLSHLREPLYRLPQYPLHRLSSPFPRRVVARGQINRWELPQPRQQSCVDPQQYQNE